MYESILGNRTNLQTIINNNFDYAFDNCITNSNHSFSKSNRKYDLQTLRYMVKLNNSKYIRKPYYSVIPLLSITDIQANEQINLKQKESIQNGAILANSKVFSQKMNKDILISQIAALNINKKSSSTQASHTNRRFESQFIKKLTMALKEINNEKENQYQSIYQQQKTSIRHLQIIIAKCQPTNPIFKQLLRQLFILQKQQQPITILLQILEPLYSQTKIKVKNSYTQKLSNTSNMKVEGSQDKYRRTYYALLMQQDLQYLAKLMYDLDEQQLFKLINQYYELFNYNQLSVDQYFKRVNQWASKYQTKYCKLISQFLTLAANSLPPQLHKQPKFPLFELLHNIVRGLAIKTSNQSQLQKFRKQIIDQFNQRRIMVLKQEMRQNKLWSLLAVKLGDYDAGFKNIRQQEAKLLLVTSICCQQLAFNKLFHITNSGYSVQQSKAELQKFLKVLSQSKQNYDLILQCLPLLDNKQRINIMASKKHLIQYIDWQNLNLFKIIPKQQRNDFIRQSILESILLNKNASSFLNIGIEGDLYSFNIQILMECLKDILFLNQNINNKDKTKFIGMLSTFRGGQIIPQSYQFKMIILEMLLQLYVMQESNLLENYKELKISLKMNLQQAEEHHWQVSNSSIRESSQRQSSSNQYTHNYQYIKKISQSAFLEKVCQHAEYQRWFLRYLAMIGEGICKIAQAKRKLVNKIKLQIWIQSFIFKITTALRLSKSQFYQQLLFLRQKCLNQFSLIKF